MKKIGFIIVVLFISGMTFASFGYCSTFNVDAKNSNIYFKMDHLVGYNSGFIKEFSGTINASKDRVKNINVDADVNSLTTFNEARDIFLKSATFFDVAQFSKISLKSKKIDEKKIIADLKFRGVAKKVELDYLVMGRGKDKKGKEKILLVLSGVIDRRDFGIDYNKNTEGGEPVLGNNIELLINLEGSIK